MSVPNGYVMYESGYWFRSSDSSGPYIFDGTDMRLVGSSSKGVVVGDIGVGKVLTAKPYSNWSFTAVQWTRDGANIVGQTAMTYIQVDADKDKVIGFIPTSPVEITPGIKAVGNKPGAPVIGVATATNSRATFNWSAPASDGGSALTGYVFTPSNGPEVYLGLVTTYTVHAFNGVPVSGVVQAVNQWGAGPVSARSGIVVPTSVVTTPPLFTAVPTVSAAAVDSLVSYVSGTASGTPTPDIATELMLFGMPQSVSTVLSEVHRFSNAATVTGINVRQTATNTAGYDIRMANPGVRCQPNAAGDPRFTVHPYLKGVPQVGRPTLLGGLTNAGTATLVLNSKVCVSNTELAEGRITAGDFSAAVASAGVMTNPASASTAQIVPDAADVGKFMYAVTSVSNGLGAVYFRTRAFKVRAAGAVSNRLRFASAGHNRLADSLYTNNTGVTMELFGFINVPIGSANHRQLNVVFNNFYVPGAGSGNTVSDTGNALTITMRLCPSGAATNATCPLVLVGAATPVIADGANDIASDAILPAAMSKTELLQGDLIIAKYTISIPNGASVPYCSGGSADTTQTYLYNPANTTITNKDNGVGSGFTGTPPTMLGDGIPFDIVGLQVSGVAPVDIGYGDSNTYNPQGRSAYDVAHNRCDDFGWPLIASGNVSRIGCTNALYINNARIQTRTKYANEHFIMLNRNIMTSANVGNADDLLAADTATYNAIKAAVDANPDEVTAGFYRLPLLPAFYPDNLDTSNFSPSSPVTQRYYPRDGLGGDLQDFYYPAIQALVGTRYKAFIDHTLAMRLSHNSSHAEYYKVQPACMTYEAGGVVHSSIQGGYNMGMKMRGDLHTLREI